MSRIQFKIFLTTLLLFVIPSTLLSQSTLDKWKNKAKQKMQQIENTAQPSSTPTTASGAGTATTSATPAVASQPTASPSPNTTPVATPATSAPAATAASPQTAEDMSWASHPVMNNGASGYAPYMAGDYTASFVCPAAQRQTNFKLSLVAVSGRALTGMISFDAQEDSGAQPVTFSLQGNANSLGGTFQLAAVKWETAAPPRRMVMTTAGAYNVNTLFGIRGEFKGLNKISGDGGNMAHCTFTANRVGNPPIQPPQPTASVAVQRVYFCFSTSDGPETYVGDDFAVPKTAGKKAFGLYKDSFLTYIQEKYAYAGPGRTSCALKKDDYNKAIFEAERKKAGKTIVETGWKYDGPFPSEGSS